MFHDGDECYRAIESGDARFDGVFYVGVTSTRIYCRPSCPARTPLRRNCAFFPSAASAQLNGFRACKRCRPDSVPGSPEWRARNDVAARAVRLIADGVVDREGVAGLARQLGYSERQLHRVLTAELGAGAIALARAQRAQTARTLIETTDMPFTEIAYAAGFGSIRQFNDTVSEVYASSPTELRRHHTVSNRGVLALRLAVREPFASSELFGFFAARAIAGVETGDRDRYARTLRLPNGNGAVNLSAAPGVVHARLELDDVRDVAPTVARLRRLCDLDADPVAVARSLERGRLLRSAVRARPGLRVPGAVDGFEMVVRAIVGQQVSVAGARTIVGRIVQQCGAVYVGADPALDRVFPSAAAVADSDLRGLGMPHARADTVRRVAAVMASGALRLDAASDHDATRAQLLAVKGIGPWTADYLAMRALGDPDAFLPGDLGVRHGAAALGIDGDLETVAQAWRPFRSYAVMHLWAATS